MENPVLLRALRKAICNRPIDAEEEQILHASGFLHSPEPKDSPGDDLKGDLWPEQPKQGTGPAHDPAARVQLPAFPLDKAHDPAVLETPAGQVDARYELRELDDLRLPTPLSAADEERASLLATTFRARYLLNTNPDEHSGPPVIAADGTVRAGRLRVLALRLVQADPEKALAYTTLLACWAQIFGFTRQQVGCLRRPVLVRRLL